MAARHVYRLQFAHHYGIRRASRIANLVLRAPTISDITRLAQLMLDAYRGSIDDDGETLDDALDEVRRYFAEEPLLKCSTLGLLDGQLVGACLVSYWRKRNTPIIAYIMTSAKWKGRGIGASLLDETLHVLAAMGYTGVDAVITGGNEPSEKLFMRSGFKREDEPAASG